MKNFASWSKSENFMQYGILIALAFGLVLSYYGYMAY